MAEIHIGLEHIVGRLEEVELRLCGTYLLLRALLSIIIGLIFIGCTYAHFGILICLNIFAYHFNSIHHARLKVASEFLTSMSFKLNISSCCIFAIESHWVIITTYDKSEIINITIL